MARRKQGYFQIIEIMLAVILVFFVISFVYTQQSRSASMQRYDLLPQAVLTNETRHMIMTHNSSLLEGFINNTNPEFARSNGYTLTFNRLLTSLETQQVAGTKQVSAYSVFIAGDESAYEPTIVRVYYWKKS